MNNHKDEIIVASEIIKNNGVILMQTDTVYGLIGLSNETVFNKIMNLKHRHKTGFGLFFKNIEHVSTMAEINTRQMAILLKYLPGYFTFILKVNEHALNKYTKNIFVFNTTHNAYTVGIRVPKSELCLSLSKLISEPLIATSANISNHENPKNFNAIDASIRNNVDYMLINHQSLLNNENNDQLASTIIDICDVNNPIIIRKGLGIWDN